MNEKMEFPYAFIGSLLISQEEIEDRIKVLGETNYRGLQGFGKFCSCWVCCAGV